MCPFIAFIGRDVMLISQSCVDDVRSSSGSVIFIGRNIGLILLTGAPGIKKCPVAPVSDIPYSMFILIFYFSVLSVVIVMSLSISLMFWFLTIEL